MSFVRRIASLFVGKKISTKTDTASLPDLELQFIPDATSKPNLQFIYETLGNRATVGNKQEIARKISQEAEKFGITDEQYAGFLASFGNLKTRFANQRLLNNPLGYAYNDDTFKRLGLILTYIDRGPNSELNTALKSGDYTKFLENKQIKPGGTAISDSGASAREQPSYYYLDNTLEGLSTRDKMNFSQKLRSKMGNKNFEKLFGGDNAGKEANPKRLVYPKDQASTTFKDLADSDENGQLWTDFAKILFGET